MSGNNLRDRITNKLVEALSKNVLPWRRPWSGGRCAGQHRNAFTGRRYTGVNPALLELHSIDLKLTSNCWATWNQWKAAGCTVKPRPAHVPPGQWGCGIVLCRPVKKRVSDRETGEERDDSYLLLRSFTVFAADQVTGPAAERLTTPTTAQPEDRTYPQAEGLFGATGADIRFGGDKAYYRRPTPDGEWPNHTDGDYIFLPERHRFHTPEDFVKTACHELGHWAEVRVGWDHTKHGYAAGELVAEVASSYTATELGVPLDGIENTAAYLRHWIAGMKESPGFAFRMFSQASKVSDFLLAFVKPEEGEELQDSEAPAEAVG